ncbi:MAG: CusA/CzcA family heavy metal efflux RND transporter [Cytophagales bacterium]|nr:CusA/CzcA family heavy metal efflux RND transporter [Cytophagales bacterium]
MIDRLILFSIKNKLLITLAVIGLVLWGSYAITKIPIDAIPDITNNQVQVYTVAPSLTAQEVESMITSPLELSFAYLPQKTQVRSISRSGLSFITIVFDDEADIIKARQLVNEQMINTIPALPKGINMPKMAPITTGLGEIYQYVLEVAPEYRQQYSLTFLRSLQDWDIKRQFAGIEGIADISSFGGLVKEYEVAYDISSMKSKNVNVSELMDALTQNNENAGGSYIEQNHKALFIRSVGMASTLEDIENIVIKNETGVPILVKHVANVRSGNAPPYGAMTKNGNGQVVGAVVFMLKGANSKKVITQIVDKVQSIQKHLPPGITIVPYINRSTLIDRAISTVGTNLAEGGLIVIFVLVLLLGNIKAGLIVASVIPLSLLFGFCMMHIFGVSANLMSLGAIDFGLVVDGAVILVEAVSVRLYSQAKSKLTSESHENIVYASCSKIRNSAAFGEIIILIVYLPIWALSGIEGKMFKPMAQTISFTLIGSLILSLTYVPMACALFLKPGDKHYNYSETAIRWLFEKYKKFFTICFRFKYISLFVVGAVFIFSLYILTTLGGEFLPKLEEGGFAVEAKISTGSSLTEMVNTCTKAEKILLQYPEVIQVVSRIGAPEIPTDPMPFESGDIMINLKKKSEWITKTNMPDLADTLNKALAVLPGAQFEFLQPIQMRTNELIAGARSDVVIKIYGDNLNTLLALGHKTASMLQKIDGVIDVKVERIEEVPQIQVQINRQKLSKYGLNIQDVNTYVRSMYMGEYAGYVYESDRRYGLVIRSNNASSYSLSDVYIQSNHATAVPLSEVAEINTQYAPMQISREDSKRKVSVTFNTYKRDVESVVGDINMTMAKWVPLPENYYYSISGQFQNLVEAKQRLYISVPIALLLIFILLYLTFGSIVYALIIFLAIPFSAIGGIFALWLRDMYFSISAGIGFIALFGVSVLNGIVLIGYLKDLKIEQPDTDKLSRILQALELRFRPVLMTMLVASLGFIPMAFSYGDGAEVQKPLATVVIGGLCSSTVLTLIIIPIVYYLTPEKTRI